MEKLLHTIINILDASSNSGSILQRFPSTKEFQDCINQIPVQESGGCRADRTREGRGTVRFQWIFGMME